MLNKLFCPQCATECPVTKSDDDSLYEIDCLKCAFFGVVIPNMRMQELKEDKNAPEPTLDDDVIIEFEPDFDLEEDDNDDETEENSPNQEKTL